MDSPTRNFLALLGIGAVLGTYAIWGFVAYVAIPLLGSGDQLAPACVLPAIILAALLAVSTGLALRTLRRQVSASHRLSRCIRTAAQPPTLKLQAMADLVGLEGRVGVVDEQLSNVVDDVI